MASSFGCNTLGPSCHFATTSAAKQEYPFNDFSVDTYSSVFDKFAMGDSDLAKNLDVNGYDTILRASLGDMLKDLLGRQPRKLELDSWFTFCDFDRSGLMSREEFVLSVQSLMDFAASPDSTKEYTSHDLRRQHWLRHRRVGYDASKSLSKPLTTSQVIGWHAKKPQPNDARHSVKHTDVTLREGRSAASYYGHYVTMGSF